MPTSAFAPRRVFTIAPDASIINARAMMTAYRIRHLPVVNEEKRLLGIISDRDIRSATPPQFGRPGHGEEHMAKFSGVKVTDIMTRAPQVLSMRHTLQDVLARFQKDKLGAFPVVDDEGTVVGIISERDLLGGFLDLLGMGRPGAFVGISVGDSPEQIRRVVNAILEAGIFIGSMLTVPGRTDSRCDLFLYLQTKNRPRVESMLKEMGFVLIDPMQWFLGRFEWKAAPVG